MPNLLLPTLRNRETWIKNERKWQRNTFYMYTQMMLPTRIATNNTFRNVCTIWINNFHMNMWSICFMCCSQTNRQWWFSTWNRFANGNFFANKMRKIWFKVLLVHDSHVILHYHYTLKCTENIIRTIFICIHIKKMLPNRVLCVWYILR